jgi:hypothetical protein
LRNKRKKEACCPVSESKEAVQVSWQSNHNNWSLERITFLYRCDGKPKHSQPERIQVMAVYLSTAVDGTTGKTDS